MFSQLRYVSSNLLLGAGLWAFDIDSDGKDELIATGRNVGFDRLELYRFVDGEPVFVQVSPDFEGVILDVAFGDYDGDGRAEPAILTAFGTQRKIVF